MKTIIKIYRVIRFRWLSVLYLSLLYRFKNKAVGVTDEEFAKYIEFLKFSLDKLFYFRTKRWLRTNIYLKKQNKIEDVDENNPPLIIVVNNELEKIKLCFNHYRKMGITKIIVLSHNSPQYVIDYLLNQDDVTLYFVRDAFSSNNKCNWIQKAMVDNGYDKWYLVVDCDELFDYIESENHKISDLIKFAEAEGIKRLNGYMLDMYSNKDLYSVDCSHKDMEAIMRFFDSDSYIFNALSVHNYLKVDNAVWGGFRQRVFNIDTLLSKQSLFYFDEDSIYETHYMLPLDNVKDKRFQFILRHYKFFKDDEIDYIIRAEERKFAERGAHYKKYTNKSNVDSIYKGTREYLNSNSLKCLPKLMNCFDKWYNTE